MRSRTSKEAIINKIETLRAKVPGIALRTSLIVGFPGETDENFEELEKFLEEYKLENVGVFAYSQEEDTPAAKMEGQVDEKVKINRQKKLMALQRKVVKAQNQLKRFAKYGWNDLPVCIAKTQYSFTDDQKQLGAPTDFTFHIRELVPKIGAGFIVALAGNMMTMPGLPKEPAAVNMTIDDNGKITGLF